jgi:hypothetical protein
MPHLQKVVRDLCPTLLSGVGLYEWKPVDLKYRDKGMTEKKA